MAPSQEVNIPQKPPMVMVDKLVSAADNTIQTTLMIRADNILCHNGLFTEAGLIENMAQTAAAGTGSKPGIREGTPPIGFIGGIRRLKINGYPAVGDEITTTITVDHTVFEASIVSGKIFRNNALLAECELKIFLIQ